jgi:hypothetical protein
LVHTTPLLQKIKAGYAMVCNPGSRSNGSISDASGPAFQDLISALLATETIKLLRL